MSERKIKLEIDGFGRPKIEAIGFEGEGCKEATSNIERVLSGGSSKVETTLKQEYYAIESAGVEVEHEAH